jgi:hypothetical protein
VEERDGEAGGRNSREDGGIHQEVRNDQQSRDLRPLSTANSSKVVKLRKRRRPPTPNQQLPSFQNNARILASELTEIKPFSTRIPSPYPQAILLTEPFLTARLSSIK